MPKEGYKAERAEVYEAIDTERTYQTNKWNESVTDTKHMHSQLEWLVYIRDYVEEALHIQSRIATPEANKQTIHSLRKIAALAVVAMEQHGAHPRQGV